ncbi:hypothetical protein [Sphingomonas fuzhouensis]|uniref:hypothetical protein n=1 Tax=Sphingomonas fuzhouensis TaxID=3106033 RepID=UPI002AFE42CA|nr:hypothetical protein [Sphingomonas sp. SGZ-02]
MTALARIVQAAQPRPLPVRRPADRGERLARALTAHAARNGCAVQLSVVSVEPWCSATFSGSVIVLAVEALGGAARSAWLADLAEADIPLGRDLIADIAVEAEGDALRLRVLLCLDAANT